MCDRYENRMCVLVLSPILYLSLRLSVEAFNLHFRFGLWTTTFSIRFEIASRFNWYLHFKILTNGKGTHSTTTQNKNGRSKQKHTQNFTRKSIKVFY